MLEYLKYLPLLSILAKYPRVVQAVSSSIPEVETIAKRFEGIQTEAQHCVAELEATLRQIEGLK